MKKVTRKILSPSFDGKDNKKDLDDKHVTFSNRNFLIKGILNGRLDLDYPSSHKIVRVFTSSTFTGKNELQDTKAIIILEYILLSNFLITL